VFGLGTRFRLGADAGAEHNCGAELLVPLPTGNSAGHSQWNGQHEPGGARGVRRESQGELNGGFQRPDAADPALLGWV